MDDLIDLGVLPESFKSYQQTYIGVFDIETLQTQVENEECNALVFEAVQYPVSIGFASNVPGVEEKFFCRASSDPEDGYEMVKSFIEYLEEAEKKFQETIPAELFDAQEKLSVLLKRKFSKEKTKHQTLDKFLKRLTLFNVFGYNCSRYDVPGQ